MTLRTRLFLVVGSLVAAVVVAQWWWMGRMAQEISDELDQVAFTVGEKVARVLVTSPLQGEHTVVQCIGSECEEKRWTSTSENEMQLVEHHRFGEGSRPLRWIQSRDGDEADGPRSTPTSEDPGPSIEVFGTVRQRTEDPSTRPQDPEDPRHGLHLETVDIVVAAQDSDDPSHHEHRDFEFVSRHVVDSSVVLRGDVDPGRAYAFWLDTTGENGHGEGVSEPRVELLDDAEVGLAVHLVHSGKTRFLEMASPTATRQIQIPQEGLASKLEEFRRRVLAGSLGILLLGLAVAGLVAHRISAPLRQLSEAARRVGDGDWGIRVAVPASGEVAQAVLAFNQMSGRLAELDARTRELDAQRHLGEIGEIARGLAHSLRNPLNALGLSLEELASGDADESTAAALAAAARRQIGRIDRNIRSFLALASQGGGTTETLDLAELVQDVALEALQDAQGRVRVEVAGCEGSQPLRAVAPELRAVIQALMINAVEASPAQGTVRAELADLGEGRFRLWIDDEGPGLPAEIRQRLFTPHLSTKSHGSGMGLFLAHRITTSRYDGLLELADRETGGTRVVLELGDRTELGDDTEPTDA